MTNNNRVTLKNGYNGLALQNAGGWWCEIFNGRAFVAISKGLKPSEREAISDAIMITTTMPRVR